MQSMDIYNSAKFNSVITPEMICKVAHILLLWTTPLLRFQEEKKR